MTRLTRVVTGSRPRLSLSTKYLVSGLVIVGVALRVWVILSPRMSAMDQDEAVAGLMARHFAEGEFTAFFWGQPYGGTAEIFLASGLFALFGPSLLLLRAVPITLHALGAWLTWRVGCKSVDRRVAAVGAALVWVWPTYAVWRSIRAHTFYASSLVLVLVVLLLAIHLSTHPSKGGATVFGFAMGFGVWVSPQTVFAFLPIVIWLFLAHRKALRLAGYITAAAGIGGSPLILANLSGETSTLVQAATVNSLGTYAETLFGLFLQPLPSALGLRVPGSANWVVWQPIGTLIYVGLLAGLVWLFLRRTPKENLLWAVVIGYLPLLSLTEYASYRAEPRYLYIIMPVLAILIAQFAMRIGLAFLIPLFLVGLSVIGLYAMHTFPKDHIVPADFTPLIQALNTEGITHVFAYHTIAYRIAFESNEEVIATPIDHIRYKPFDTAVRTAQNLSYVFAPFPDVAEDFQTELVRAGISYTSSVAGDFQLVTPSVPVYPEEFEALQP